MEKMGVIQPQEHQGICDLLSVHHMGDLAENGGAVYVFGRYVQFVAWVICKGYDISVRKFIIINFFHNPVFNQIEIAVLSILLNALLPDDHITRIVFAFVAVVILNLCVLVEM